MLLTVKRIVIYAITNLFKYYNGPIKKYAAMLAIVSEGGCFDS